MEETERWWANDQRHVKASDELTAYDRRQGEADAGGQAEEAVMGLRAGGAKVRPEVGAGFPGLAHGG